MPEPEIESEELEPEVEPEAEPESQEEDPEPEPEEKSASDDEPIDKPDLSGDEPDERAPVPVKSFVAYKAKVKQQLAAALAEAAQHKAELAKAASRGDIDPSEYRRQKNALDKIKAGLEKYPEFDAVLYAFEQGLDPDLRVLAQALDPRVKALTTQDPATQRALLELRQQTARMQAQQYEFQLERQKTKDDIAIRELHGGDPKSAANFIRTVDAIARAAAKGIPEEYFAQWATTARLEIAKAVAPLSKTERESLLNQQRDLKPVKKGAGLPIPKKGAKPADDDPMPNMFSEPDEHKAWMARERKRTRE